MKKILIGLAVGALAFTATSSSVSAADKTIYDIVKVVSGVPQVGTLLVDSAGLDTALDTCGNGTPQYTVFFPSIFTGAGWVYEIDEDGTTAGEVLLGKFGLSLGQLLAQPALIKAVLLNHVVKSEILPAQLDDAENTKFTTMGGLVLLKTSSAGKIYVNGLEVTDPTAAVGDACNGYVYLVGGILAPNDDLATIGLTNDGSTTQAAASGASLPKTGSESMALTYAALASLIMGAGVLVIRRRSVA